MSELSLTLNYAPAPELMALEPGTCQCSQPADLAEFEKSIRASPHFHTLAALKPQQTDLEWLLT